MKIYRTRCSKLTGTSYREVNKKAQAIYREIKSKTKRRPYVRSEYFNKEKIFLDLFWQHLWEKENLYDKLRRLKYFPCAIELIQKTRFDPELRKDPENRKVLLYRFAGSTRDNEPFFVQIKEDLKTKKKFFISAFPEQK